MGADLDHKAVERAYARWAPVYDIVFNRIMDTGRRAAVAAAAKAGRRILDVGVGTGLELPYFGPNHEIVGVDLSEPMLRKAQERVASKQLKQVTGLCVMDAQRLAVADASFDAVIAPYVITTVPDPMGALDELARVVKPGGEIVLLNHISADSGPRASFERWLGRQTQHLGWRPEFPWERISSWYENRPHITLVERRTMPPLGLFALIRFSVGPKVTDAFKTAI
ncbi:demethylmenaquinone methyltransferase [Variibacter gotjawalensis]|uniref:Demethylmenaquinone methyltransferase n=1 Tax=Variibacter gotjawalensis TaxID=1333996 RepID=A0A0S3PTC1_9BRAD|nr:class I SAM-dependent methyltransferase [Variibacter gotjawalensis]NIK49494.1 phosphatidylethanolamine/phosphatidyl-N-methylethanolamine N-methyltransferase [Variibacter gotjawalensis]RZS51346.1 phosphatidylethanolamine N-methyltransferase /phosphatidyl-N-methylethanolamine N-methyltransferase [Variibacter gotjawalensis]BAT59179.1 demethylmenaquinone methyltransferase [Variibacter gotjawalensis]